MQIKMWSAIVLTGLSMRVPPLQKNELLVTVQRGVTRTQIWSDEIRDALPERERTDEKAWAQALVYQVLAVSMDAEVLTRDRWAFETPPARFLYLSRACEMCRSDPQCELAEISWDPLSDTAVLNANAKSVDRELFRKYESFDHEGGSWRYWPSLSYESADAFLKECSKKNFPQLDRLARRAHRAFGWEKAWTFSHGNILTFTRELYKKYLFPSQYVWSNASKRLGVSFSPKENWLRGRRTGLSGVDLEDVLEILVSLP